MAREEEQPAITSRPPYFQPIWLIGLSVIVLDGIGDFIFIGMAPQSLLVPLGALSLGFNCLLAPFFHNEVITRGILLSTAIVYCGTIVTVLYAPKENEDYTLMNLRDFATTVEFLWFELFNVCFLTITYGLGTMKGFGAGMYCALAGCFGGQTLLLAKCLSELLLNALFHDDWVDWKISPAPYLMAMGMVGTLVTQLHFLNTGLHKFEALRVGPLYQCFFICFGITGGLIFFQEVRTNHAGVVYAVAPNCCEPNHRTYTHCTHKTCQVSFYDMERYYTVLHWDNHPNHWCGSVGTSKSSCSYTSQRSHERY